MKKIIILVLVCFSIGRITRISIDKIIEDKIENNQQIEELKNSFAK